MTIRNRPALRAAVVTTVAAGALGIGAGAAYAKSDISFAAGPHQVRVGAPVHLTGYADDDDFSYNRFCVQQGAGRGGWATLRCSRGGYNGGGGLNVWIRPAHRGELRFRAVLTMASSPRDRHPRIDLVSRTFRVDVS